MSKTTSYSFFRRCWPVVTLCWLLLSGGAARAQSGPVGNEWIVAGQRYFKVKVARDGIYKLDYQYLTRAGITGVAPSQLQLWRRGREVAVYGGGNQAALDATTFLEFYGQHNDGRLDGELYKSPSDQAHPFYSFYTDTAAYFITWSPGRGGRRMAQPVAAGGAVHPHRLQNQLNLKVNIYLDNPNQKDVYLPWVEKGEGYFSSGTTPLAGISSDSLIRNLAATGPVPQVEAAMYGANGLAHATEVLVVPPSGAERSLGVIRWTGQVLGKKLFSLLRSDVSATGRVTIKYRLDASSVPGDNYYAAYVRYITPQLSRWFTNRHSVFFQNDSLLAGPATYEFSRDSIPATVVGFDVQDQYNVQRIASASPAAGPLRFVFPSANASATRRLMLADEAALAVPPLAAREVVFRTMNPATPTFIIITHPQLQKAEPTSASGNAVQDYATYRASAAGGSYSVLTVTAPELYDQFTYGDRSWLALRHFTRWLVAANPTATNRYLLLLGKGIVPSEAVLGTSRTYYRNAGTGSRPGAVQQPGRV